jgi:alkylation response protein AidB-like acyl-CoA dehydrogenase
MQRDIFTSDHDAFRDVVRTYVDRHLLPKHDEYVAAKEIGREAWLEAGKQGLLALEVPVEHGGDGAGDYRFNAVLGEELAKVSVAYNSCFQIHYDIVAPYLVDLCTDDQKERWLPRFCSGELITAIAMTEPSAGSDLAALKTTAVPDGTDWILNGSKTFITNGASADLVVLAAKTSPNKGAKGITLFCVESGAPGFERGRKLDKVGQPESNTAELFFNDLRMPGDHVLGEVDRGFIYMMERLSQERISAAVANITHAATALAETLVYARERHAFGQSIGSMQFNKFRLAEMVTQIDVAQAFVDRCVMEHVHGRLTAVDAAKAKWWTAETQSEVLDACVQLHGGYGYMREYRVAQAWMDARVTKIWAGTNEIMKEIIGRDLGL